MMDRKWLILLALPAFCACVGCVRQPFGRQGFATAFPPGYPATAMQASDDPFLPPARAYSVVPPQGTFAGNGAAGPVQPAGGEPVTENRAPVQTADGPPPGAQSQGAQSQWQARQR